jgi:hypothetical protein
VVNPETWKMDFDTREVMILVVGMMHGWAAHTQGVLPEHFIGLMDVMLERVQPETDTWLEVCAAADTELWLALRKPA